MLNDRGERGARGWIHSHWVQIDAREESGRGKYWSYEMKRRGAARLLYELVRSGVG